jgi:hypothetical protein
MAVSHSSEDQPASIVETTTQKTTQTDDTHRFDEPSPSMKETVV